MKCSHCWKQGSKRTNKILSHTIVGDFYAFVCDECYDEIKRGLYPLLEIVKGHHQVLGDKK